MVQIFRIDFITASDLGSSEYGTVPIGYAEVLADGGICHS